MLFSHCVIVAFLSAMSDNLNMKNAFLLQNCITLRSFDEKTYICNTCRKHISINEMPYKAVFNKSRVNPVPDELKDFKKLEKILVSIKIILKKKIAIMNLQKPRLMFVISPLRQQIYAITADSSGLIVVKLKQDLFEPVRPNVINQALNYLNSHNKNTHFRRSLRQRNEKFSRY